MNSSSQPPPSERRRAPRTGGGVRLSGVASLLDDRAGRIRQPVEERTGDPELQERVIQAVLARIAGDL